MHLPYYTEIYILRTADMRSAKPKVPPPPAEKAAYAPVRMTSRLIFRGFVQESVNDG